MDFTDMGIQIRKRRIARSWSQEDLASRTGLSATYIGMIERGEKVPQLKTFIVIANTLGSSADELLSSVLNNGFIVRMTEYTNRMGELNKADRKMAYDILDAILKNRSLKWDKDVKKTI